jgi:hypothetical protein
MHWAKRRVALGPGIPVALAVAAAPVTAAGSTVAAETAAAVMAAAVTERPTG